MRCMTSLTTRALILGAALAGFASPAMAVVLLPQVHAHNDYAHKRPLFDALDHGICSVEADVFLVDGRLLVGHTRHQLKRRRTLERLYLNPLRKRVRRNGGRVYRNGPPFTLLIDLKSKALPTYQAVSAVLKQYSDIFTSFHNGVADPKAVTAIISGNSPGKYMASESVRYAALDGRKKDLDSDAPVTLIPWISENWRVLFDWMGDGPMPADQRQRLKEFVAKAHAKGRKVRFYATPNRPAVWTEELNAGVDLLNADDLDGVQAFMLKRMEKNKQGR